MTRGQATELALAVIEEGDRFPVRIGDLALTGIKRGRAVVIRQPNRDTVILAVGPTFAGEWGPADAVAIALGRRLRIRKDGVDRSRAWTRVSA